MGEFFKVWGEAFSRMDQKSWASLGVTFFLLTGLLTVYFFGQQWLHLEGGAPGGGGVSELMARAGTAPLALLAVIIVFVLLAMTGFPQVLLITASVLTFGAVTGAAYAWIATLVSASVTFFLGHLMGAGWVARLNGKRARAMNDFLGRRGIMASGLIRVIPSAPFIVVNAAAGAAPLPFWKFALGTGLGIIPKIALVAGLGALAPRGDWANGWDSTKSFLTTRSPADWVIVVLIIVVIAVLGWAAYRLYRRLRVPQ
ncbi:MAG: VTT domain-containing protein [Pseudomonadota bacterium]